MDYYNALCCAIIPKEMTSQCKIWHVEAVMLNFTLLQSIKFVHLGLSPGQVWQEEHGYSNPQRRWQCTWCDMVTINNYVGYFYHWKQAALC